MLSINEKLKIGKVYFDIQTEYKPSLDIIVGEILKDGRVLKKISQKRNNKQEIEEQVRDLHKRVIELLYQKISSAVKHGNKQMADLPKLRNKFVALIKDSLPERNIVYAHFKIHNIKLEFKNGFLFEKKVNDIKERIISSKLNTKLGEIEEIILHLKGYTAILLSDNHVEFLLVVKNYRLGTASIFAEKTKQKIKKVFYEKSK
jgi:hypothetical protein